MNDFVSAESVGITKRNRMRELEEMHKIEHGEKDELKLTAVADAREKKVGIHNGTLDFQRKKTLFSFNALH